MRETIEISDSECAVVLEKTKVPPNPAKRCRSRSVHFDLDPKIS